MLKSDPKQLREIDKAYLAYLRLQPCLVCDRTPCDSHHTISTGAGGSDYKAVCLCREHHSECHQIGKETFQDKYRISFDRAIEGLLLEYILNKFDVKLVDILISYIKTR